MDSFSCAVHKNDSVAAVEKTNNLKSLVSGLPDTCIFGFQLTDANCNVATNPLEERHSI